MQNEIKERPILFNAEMVRAILEGRKTQTRRVIEIPKPYQPRDRGNGVELGKITSTHPKKGKYGLFVSHQHITGESVDLIPCKYGEPGDCLWVRESIQQVIGGVNAFYKADGAIVNLDTWCWERSTLPSIHLPRGLSRITLKIVSVRVERLQDISEEDAKADGTENWSHEAWGDVVGQCDDPYRAACYQGHRKHFQHLWNSINAKRGYSWESNPWVWVIEFKKIG